MASATSPAITRSRRSRPASRSRSRTTTPRRATASGTRSRRAVRRATRKPGSPTHLPTAAPNSTRVSSATPDRPAPARLPGRRRRTSNRARTPTSAASTRSCAAVSTSPSSPLLVERRHAVLQALLVEHGFCPAPGSAPDPLPHHRARLHPDAHALEPARVVRVLERVVLGRRGRGGGAHGEPAAHARLRFARRRRIGDGDIEVDADVALDGMSGEARADAVGVPVALGEEPRLTRFPGTVCRRAEEPPFEEAKHRRVVVERVVDVSAPRVRRREHGRYPEARLAEVLEVVRTRTVVGEHGWLHVVVEPAPFVVDEHERATAPLLRAGERGEH